MTWQSSIIRWPHPLAHRRSTSLPSVLVFVLMALLLWCGRALLQNARSIDIDAHASGRQQTTSQSMANDDLLTAFRRQLVEDDDIAWHRRNRTQVAAFLDGLTRAMRMSQDQATSTALADASESGAYEPRPPIIVLGTAGTGTRVFNQLLTAAGVHMSRVVNSQKDSRVFIDVVKNHDGFGKPLVEAASPGEDVLTGFLAEGKDSDDDDVDVVDENAGETASTTLMDWLHRHGKVDYELEDVAKEPFFEPLRDAVHRAKRLFDFEVAARRGESSIAPQWGFKEPQAVFVLPFILDAWKPLSGLGDARRSPLTIVHVVRDGRDIAFSKQQRRKYQNHYIRNLHPHTAYNLTAGELSTQWAYATAVAAVWEHVNLGVRAWALRQGAAVRYVPIRLEDVCRVSTRLESVKKFYQEMELEVPGDEELITLLHGVVDEQRCHLGKYLSKDPPLVDIIENVIDRGLTTFGYKRAANQVFPRDLVDAATSMISPEVANVEAYQPTAIITFANADYAELLTNMLRHLRVGISAGERDSPANTTILIIATESRTLLQMMQGVHVFDHAVTAELYAAYQSAVKDFGSTFHILPYFLPSTELLTDNNAPRTADGFVNLDIWRFRLRATRALLEAGWVVSVQDVDALTVRDVRPLLEASSQFDIMASRGRFPYDLGEQWGQTICMGWIWFRPTLGSITAITLATNLVETYRDDQAAINHAIEQLWSWTWLNGTNDDSLIGETTPRIADTPPIRVRNLPFAVVPRYCRDALREYRKAHPGEDLLTDARLLRRIFPDAYVMHCYTPKSGDDKLFWFRRWGLLQE